MELKHSCSQTQFKTAAAWCWDAGYSPQEGGWHGLSPPAGMLAISAMAGHKTNVQHCLHFSLFLIKVKIFLRFLSLSEHRSFHRSLIKAKQQNSDFWKVGGIPVVHQCPLSAPQTAPNPAVAFQVVPLGRFLEPQIAVNKTICGSVPKT